MSPSARLVSILFAVGASTGCQAPKDRIPSSNRAPPPRIRTSSTSVFALIREGHRPVFRQGDLHVYVSPNPADLDLGLPGIAFGAKEGPRYGLLGGYFAPRILAPDSHRAYQAVIDAEPEALRVRFFDQGNPRLDVRISARAGRPRATLSAEGLVAMPADRAQVFGRRAGRPAFSRALTAGEPPDIDPRSADRVEVRSKRQGAFRFETSCPRVFLVSPIPRGSTSVFLLAPGARPPPSDPLYAPSASDEDIPQPDCGGTVTSTLTVPSPG